MSSPTYSITLTAKDGTKQTFDAIKRGADQDVAALKALGRDGSAALKQVDQAATTTGRSQEALRARLAAVGAVAATAAGLLSDWNRSSQDADAIQRQLEASIAATGEEYSTYADRVEAAGEAAVRLGQDDEAASQAISALTQVTGSANVALDQMGLVMDLAAAKHMSLESAAELVGKVLEGNVGILNRAGFAIDENATATEALAQVQEAVAGQAEASATTYGRLREELANVTDSIGGSIGQFSGLLALLPGVSSGFTLAGSAIGAVAPNLTKAGAASAALDLALGPVGLVAAAVAGGAAIYEFAKKADAANLSASEAAKGITSFKDAIADIGPGDQAASLASYVDLLSQIAAQTQENKKLSVDAALATANAYEAVNNATMGGTQEQADAARAALAAAQAYESQLQGNIVSQEEFNALQAALLDITIDQNPLNAGLVTAELDRLRAAYEADALSADQYVAAVIDLDANHKTFGLTLEDLAGTAQKTASEISGLAREEARLAFATAATEDKNKTLTDANNALTTSYADTAEGAKVLTDLQLIAAEGTDAQKQRVFELFALYQTGTDTNNLYLNTVALEANLLRQSAGERDRATAAMVRQEAAAYSMAAATQAAGGAIKQQTAEQAAAESKMNALEGAAYSMAGAQQDVAANTNAAKEEMKKAADEARGYAEALIGTISLAQNLRPVDIGFTGGDKVTGTAAEVQQSGAALQSVLGIFTQIDNLSKGHDQAGSIVENLIGTPDKVGAVVALLDQGRISQTRFNMTVEAGNNILARSGEIESDLNVTRAKQLPLLDQADARYAALIDDIAHMSAEQATATLGFMDANESMKAQSAVMLAASAAAGELGANGKQAAADIIEGAVAADPVLEQMLTQIGLVARDHEGNLVVNFDNADTLKNSTDALTGAVTTLTAALLGIPTNVDISITATDMASGVAQYVADVMAGLNGTSVSTTIYMDYVKRGDGTQMEGGGLVTAAAAGGRLINDAQRIRVNEGGIEMATLPTGDDVWLQPGTMVTPHAASKMGRSRGEGGRAFNNYGTIQVFTRDPDDFMRQMQSYAVAGR